MITGEIPDDAHVETTRTTQKNNPIHTYKHVHARMHACTNICIETHAHSGSRHVQAVRASTPARPHAHTHTHTHACMHARTNAQTHKRTDKCTHVCTLACPLRRDLMRAHTVTQIGLRPRGTAAGGIAVGA